MQTSCTICTDYASWRYFSFNWLVREPPLEAITRHDTLLVSCFVATSNKKVANRQRSPAFSTPWTRCWSALGTAIKTRASVPPFPAARASQKRNFTERVRQGTLSRGLGDS